MGKYTAAQLASWDAFHTAYPDASRGVWRAAKSDNAHRIDLSLQAVPLVSGATIGVKRPASDEEWRTYFARLEDADEAKSGLSPLQEETTFIAPDDGLPVAVAVVSDMHEGASGVLYRRIREDMETIAGTDGLYGIGNGDYTENANPHSKIAHAMFGGLSNDPGVQDRMAYMHMDIARGRWLCIAEGNHDAWTSRFAGIGRTADFAARLGAPYFSQGGGTVYAHVGEQMYVLAVRHNGRGNSKLNTTNAQRRTYDEWLTYDGLDAVCLAHYHFNDLHIASRKGGRCVYLRSGTYKTHDAYSQESGYKPEYGVPLLIMLPDEHKIIPFRGDDFTEAVAYFKHLRESYVRKNASERATA